MRKLDSEVKFIEYLSQFNLGEDVMEQFRQDFCKGMNGDTDSLIGIASFFHEAMMYKNAYDFYKLAANYQHPEALYMLGNYAYEGLVENESNRKAFLYYEHAAGLGHADAMNNLADMFLNGEGTGVDEKLALYGLKRLQRKM